MKYGQISGIERPVSRVILGTIFLPFDDPERLDEILSAYLERGGNMIDTANVYAGGKSERGIGDWIRRTGRRDDVLILTKGAHHDAKGKRVSPNEISLDLGMSLERLAMKHVDVYVLHRDDPEVPVGPIVEALNAHVARGRVSAIGGSNWTHQRVEEANAYAREHGLRPFDVSSPNLALAVPNEPMWADCISISGDSAAQHWYRDNNMPILSWSSQANGFFSGRFSPGNTENKDVARVYYSDVNWERLRRAGELGKEMDRSAIQVALAWVLSQPSLSVHALIGPRSLEELNSSLDGAEIELTHEQVRWLNLEA